MVEMKHAFVKPSSVIEKNWLSRIDSIKDATPEEIETLLAQMELLMIHSGKKFCVQVNQQGFARIALPVDDVELILLSIPLDCLEIM